MKIMKRSKKIKNFVFQILKKVYIYRNIYKL